MGKLVVLKLGEGSFEQGFSVTMQIGEEGDRPSVEVAGKLPPAPELTQDYGRWQSSYRVLGLRSRLNAPSAQVTNVAFMGDCQEAAQILRDRLNAWLQADSFRPIREKWLEQLSPNDTVRVILQGTDPQLQRLPWHLWDLIERYSKAEIALSAPIYERVVRSARRKGKVKILAILGNSTGIDVQADRLMLEQLPDAEVCFLVEPQRQDLTDQLWEQRWDVLFFAGHSTSQSNGETGQIFINLTDSLTIGQLRFALKKAMERGLKLAIFNSCDGLGLARELADLQIPQLIVMREPVPDRIAQIFLQYFLAAFSRNKPLYLAVREARERLQGLEDQFPCATWLPVICQNPAEIPPTWEEMTGKQYFDTAIRSAIVSRPRPKKRRFSQIALTSLAIAASLIGIRSAGLLQPLELTAFDQMMRLRPAEGADPRILLITIDEDDIQAQGPGRGSLSDGSLNQLLEALEQHHPRTIGLDIYRDFPADTNQPGLVQRLQQTPSLIAVCKGSDSTNNVEGIAPPPEISVDRLGFSDFIEDTDGVVRRQILFMPVESGTSCTTPYAFSTQLVFRYLAEEGILPAFTGSKDLQLGTTIFRRLSPHRGGYQGIDAGASQVLLNYRATPQIASQVSLTQVLTGEVSLDIARDKIVLIGSTSRSTRDYWSTPYGTGATEKMPGVFVQAHMVSQILSAVIDRRPLLWAWHSWGDAIWIVGWSLVGGFVVWRIRSHSRSKTRSLLYSVLAVTASVGILYAVCFSGLIRGGWLPLIPSGLALVIASGASVALTAPKSH